MLFSSGEWRAARDHERRRSAAISSWRANGVATKYLARENAENVGLIGSGWQAVTRVMAVCEARRIKKNQSLQSDKSQSR